MPLREPAVSRRTLEITAGTLWAAVGVFLIARALLWLPSLTSRALLWAALGAVLGLVKGRFVFARLAGRNIARIHALSPHKEKICIFAFQAMQSYLIVLVMVALGILLRTSGLPRSVLVAVYLLVGVGLAIGSLAYFRSDAHAA